ncbi:amino acid adenylation domain-containing protein [Bacillus anthracis]|uniref:non-ribosomal peptide synthetase n=1 Tax=Bacillus anthracis TaxID=1392 RepID=UPI002DB847DC|nr:non-ribosomal peptide synthetase [Bacillus anthracis]MEB9906106.1 amino acid adenylation domain-containing protein [Bacillus anthracis]MEC1953774.1 amino acid adenylation domain-containing protein [Bacillus anthracis]
MAKKFYMSNNQKRLYIINQLQGKDVSYNTPKVLFFPGRFDLKTLNRSFNKLCKQHELLRTTFSHNGDKFYQIVQEEVNVKVEVNYDVNKTIKESFNDFLKPFDLETAPVMRLKVQELENASVLMFDFHHIICDAISVHIFVDDLLSLYKGETLQKNKIQYKDFAAWQNSKDMSEHEAFWLEEFSKIPPAVDLKTDFVRPKWKSIKGQTIHKNPDYKLSELVKGFCHRNDTTEFMTLLSAFMAFLSKYNSQKDITVGIPVANRTHQDAHNMVGMFVNTLAVHTEIDKTKSFTNLLSVMKDKVYSIFDHQEYPFEELIEKLNLERDVSRNPLFDIMFVFQNNENNRYVIDQKELTEIKDIGYPVAKFDLTLTINSSEAGYEISWEYCSELFKEETIKYIDKLFGEFLKNAIAAPTERLEALNMLNDYDYTSMFDRLIETPRKSIKSSVIDSFYTNVKNWPNKKALIMGDKSMTFTELNELSNRLASKLISKGIKQNSVVALLFNRSFETVTTILGVLKAGGTFLPIEPNLPEDRINYILQDSNCSLLISNLEEFDFSSLYGDVLQYKDINLSEPMNEQLNVERNENMLMYIIYTSGSTGKPKGVAIKESSLLNYLDWGQEKYITSRQDCFGFYSPLSFDLTITSVFLPLVSGLTMKIYQSKDYASALIDLVNDNTVTILKLTPSHMKMISQLNLENSLIHTFIVGGEELTVQAAKEMTLKINHPISIINEYGPTEATIGCAFHKYNIQNDNMMVPIGRPINNTQLYVLNSDLQYQPYGVVGELYISGECLAYGYYNNPKLTNEKFIDNPFISGEKMYATGDLVYKLPNDNLVYCGRIDDQIKLKGFRIDLGEVEKVLKTESKADEVSVHIRNLNDSEYLCAYLVGSHYSENELKNILGKALPDYMIPTFMINVDNIPLTSNGKVDKKKLPDPILQSHESYIAPRNGFETAVTDIFSEILGTEVGIEDNFFELGGDSIKGIRIIAKLREQGYILTLREIMERKVLLNIFDSINILENDSIYQNEIAGETVLSPIQKQFMGSELPEPEYFNQSVLLESKGSINTSIVRESLLKIVKHHDILRATFNDGKQVIKSATDGKLYEYFEFDLSNVQTEEEFNSVLLNETLKLTNSMNLNDGPLVKAGHFITNESDYLFITIHHLVIDSVSWQIIIEDLNKLYQSGLDKKEMKLPNKTASYKQWSEEQVNLAEHSIVKKELPYWKKIEKDLRESALNPSRTKRESVLDQVEVNFSEEITSNLIYKAIKPYGLEAKEVLLTALFRAIAKINNSTRAAVNLETHGRENSISSLPIERTVGWFTNMYPVVVKNIGNTLKEDIITVKETLKRVPNQGIGYGILKNNWEENLCEESYPDITFNYLGEQVKYENDETFFISEIKHANAISNKNIFGTPISMDGIIVNRELSLLISFDISRFDKKFIENLAQVFEKEVRKVVEHCSSEIEIIKTPSDYGELNLSLSEFSSIQQRVESANGRMKRMYPLTPMQEGILFHTLNDGDKESYVVQGIFKANKLVEMKKFKMALKHLGNKHEVLKTSIFSSLLSEPRQVIIENKEIECQFIDFSQEHNVVEQFNQVVKEDLQSGFDIEKDSLIRFIFVKESEEEFKLIMTFHHIIMDGWCMAVLMNDLTEIYDQLISSNDIVNLENPKKLQNTFEDYVRVIRDKNHEETLKYWGNLLDDFHGANTIEPVLELTTDEKNIERTMYSIPVNLFESIKDYAKQNNSTVNTVIELAWGILLQSYNYSNDVVFGKVLSGRDSAVKNVEEIIGLFINTVPVRVSNEPTDLVSDVLKQLQSQAINSMENGYNSLADIQGLTELGSDLIQTLLIFENYYVAEKNTQSATGLIPILDTVREETNYDLTLSVDLSDSLNFDLLFNVNKYTRLEAGNILGRLETILNQIVSNPKIKMSEMEVLTEVERTMVLNDFNNTVVEYDAEKPIICLIEENATCNPGKIAVVYQDIELTYKDLNEKANIIANELQERGIKRNSVVAIKLKNSPEMIISILGILKTGAAYVPLDPSYPTERIDTILEDCGATILLSDEEYQMDKLISLDVNSILTNDIAHTKTKFKNISYPEDLMLILYTSGTTGKPKGVMLKNSNVLSYIYSFKKEFLIDQSTRFLQQATYTFDMFIEEVFPTLAFGGTLIIYPRVHGIDFEELCQYINEKEVNILSCSPLTLNEINKLNKTKSVKTYISGGEEIKPNYYDKIIQSADVYNTYGPTETTVCCSYFKIDKNQLNNVSIGRPIANAQMYILANDQLCGINTIGEICISGNGVTAGYLNRDELTADKFVPNPYGEGKVYRTGDFGKWMPDGTVTYMGRIDNQIKLRGYRIELGEIEVIIRKKLDVLDVAVVLKKKEEEKIICVYVQSDVVTREEVYKELKANLPIYMVPAHIDIVDSIPMKLNGKIDSDQLEIPTIISFNHTNEPMTEDEEKVLSAFTQALEGLSIGLHDDFFEVGGHSLKAVRLINTIEQKTDVRLTVTEIFEKRTVKEISKLVKAKEVSTDYQESWSSLEEEVEELV